MIVALFHRRYFNLPVAARHLDPHIIVMPQKQQIDNRTADKDLLTLLVTIKAICAKIPPAEQRELLKFITSAYAAF